MSTQERTALPLEEALAEEQVELIDEPAEGGQVPHALLTAAGLLGG